MVDHLIVMFFLTQGRVGQGMERRDKGKGRDGMGREGRGRKYRM